MLQCPFNKRYVLLDLSAKETGLHSLSVFDAIDCQFIRQSQVKIQLWSFKINYVPYCYIQNKVRLHTSCKNNQHHEAFDFTFKQMLFMGIGAWKINRYVLHIFPSMVLVGRNSFYARKCEVYWWKQNHVPIKSELYPGCHGPWYNAISENYGRKPKPQQ